MLELITSESSYYDYARQEWNRAIDKYPLGIAYCNTYDDVRDAILFARKNFVKIRIRTGGHHYEGFSTGTKVLVIDISNLNRVKINYEANTITVEGGTFLGNIYTLLGSNEIPFPGGSCPTVGISGLTLGGGWGYSSRYLGLTCDSLLQVKMFNYNGCLITADKYINSDLFWACKGGGGGNFGVVISMTFKLPPKIDKVTAFNIIYNSPSKEEQVIFLDTWQKWITTTSNKINMKCSIVNSKDDDIYILCTGLLYGTPKELKELLIPFSRLDGYNLDFNYTSFLQAINIIGSFYPQYDYFTSYGRFVSEYYSKETLKSLINIINSPRPNGSTSTLLNFYGLGGQVSEINKYNTAFYYRNSDYIILLESNFENNLYKAENISWLNKYTNFFNSITEGSYINFPYYPLANYHYEYYGKNSLRLKCIKEKYDPIDFFRFPQSI